MSDSPFYKSPIDPIERPILDKLVRIRDNLELLKSDKSKHIRSQDVVTYYDQIIQQVHALNEIRTTKREEQNRLDSVLDDCLQLISLFFLTIGRNAEAPAAYSVTSSIKRLLDHLKEAGYYSPKDLTSLSQNLDKIQASVDGGKDKYNQDILLLLQTRVDNCKLTLAELKLGLSTISSDLMPTYEKLVSILRSLSGLNVNRKYPTEFPEDEVRDFQRQLKDIEKELGSSQALEPSDQTLEEQYVARLEHINYTTEQRYRGKDLVLDFLARVMLWSEIMMQRKGEIQERFQDKVEELWKLRNTLEKLHLTQAWSLRETDLYSYQRRLDRFDESRVDGVFVDAEGRPAELYEQRALLYLLRKSYATVYHMITSSEPVSEALTPIYNQLLTLRKCLYEVKNSGGVSSARELYPYSMKLHSIDNLRHDGKFTVNGDIPEGQGSVITLLEECFEVAYELRNDADHAKDSGNEDEVDEDAEERTRMRLEQARLEDEEKEDEVPDMNEDEEEEEADFGGGLARTTSRRHDPIPGK